MTDGETKRVASAAAKEALQEFLLMLGVDVSTPAGILEIQDDFRHIRHTRKAIEKAAGQLRSKAIDVLTGSIVTGIIGAVTVYIFHR